ncbi:MAG: carbonic anhydrase [Candidatus Korobacteraceae bacterium]
MNIETAWTRIAAGVRKFQTEVFPEQRALFESLRKRQDPLALFITCADSRILPNLITQSVPGEIFTDRNPGNMVPPYGEFVGGVTSGVEYAMLVLKVPLIIICGHTDCGVMKALLHPESATGMPGVQQWMRHGNEARHRVLRDYADRSDEEKVHRLAEANVLEQIANLKTHPSVASRLAAGEVTVRGWVYDIGSGSIWQAEPETGEFAEFYGE